MRRLSLGGGTRREYIGKNRSLGWFLVVEIVQRSWGDARSLLWQRNDACFDDDRGDVGWRSGRFWEEMEGVLCRMGGHDLHDEDERGERERTREGGISAARRRQSENVSTSRAQHKKITCKCKCDDALQNPRTSEAGYTAFSGAGPGHLVSWLNLSHTHGF
jgi:hypothetical protein